MAKRSKRRRIIARPKPHPRNRAAASPKNRAVAAAPGGGEPDAAAFPAGKRGDAFPFPVVVLLLAATVWASRYWHCAEFGLYEDDFARVLDAMESTGSGLLHGIWTMISHFEGQGRPLHPSFIYLFSFLGNKLAGLDGIYWVAYLIVALNAVLVYTLLKRVFRRQLFAFTGALAYCVFPADTTQAYLTLAFGGQPSITFFLLASHAYLSRRRILSYPLILGSLVCYETVFPVFLAVPLLEKKWDRRLARRMIRHGAVMAVMIGAAALARKMTGEGFVAALHWHTVLTRPFRQMLVGPVTSLWMFFYRPAQMFRENLDQYWEVLCLALLAFAAVLYLLRLPVRLRESAPPNRPGKPKALRRAAATNRRLARLAIAGLAMLALAYPLTFTVPAGIIDGRDTRVHMAAALGASLLWACLSTAVICYTRFSRAKHPARWVLAALLAGLLGFGWTVQRDYRVSWRYQQSFFSDLLRLCPDLQDGTVILVEESGLRNTRQISSWGWCLPYLLRYAFRFPGDWETPPLVYALQGNWTGVVKITGNLLEAVNLKGWFLEKIPNPKFILLEADHGRLVRHPNPLVIDGKPYPLQEPAVPTLSRFEHRVLYDYILPPPGVAPAAYIRR